MFPVPSSSLKRSLMEATVEYENQLEGSPGERALLERGLSKETINRFRLGYVGAPLKGDEMFAGRISVPYLTVSGVVSMRFKRITGEGGKMLVRDHDPGRPYNVRDLFSEGPIFIVEGEPDSWTATECGMLNVAIPGADNWKPTWRRLFRGWEVTVIGDGDSAGKKLTDQIVKDLANFSLRTRILVAPEGEDLTSIFQQFGRDKVREWVGIQDAS